MRIKSALFQPVDNSPLIIFRIVFGFLLMAEGFGAILTGWVKETFIDPEFTFTFIGFEWLQPLPGDGMYYYFILLGLCGAGVMFGVFYRVSAIAFTILWAGVYFMQKSNYNNHYYLLLLLSFLMIFVPAHRYKSVDVIRNPRIQSLTCPNWAIGIFVLELFIVYTYAAIAKIYPDWLKAEPVNIWFEYKSDYPVIGPLLVQRWFQYFISYGGILFDLLIIPLLLYRRTRIPAVVVSVCFHLANSFIFRIGIFPYLMIGSLVLFFPPESVRKFFFPGKPGVDSLPPQGAGNRKLIMSLLGIFFFFQITLPLRHLFYPGNVHWTEEGHRLSWHMMLRAKMGTAYFRVVDPKSGKVWHPDLHKELTPIQENTLPTHPDMIWQYSQRLKKNYQEMGYPDVEIYVTSRARLNKHPFQQLIDPEYDMAKAEWHIFKSEEWIVPLK